MKKLALILLTLIFAFGFSSAAFANDGHNDDKGKYSETEKVTFHKGITTIVKTKKEVSHDKIVKVEKSTEQSSERKSKTDTYEEEKVEVKKEKHPKHDWYRDVTIKTTYKVTKTTSWDEVTRVHTIKKFITPVKIVKKTVTTIKHKGKPGSGGKVISKDVKKSVEKKRGQTQKKVTKETEVFKKNEDTSYDKDVLDVEKTKGKWEKGGKHNKK